MSTDRDRISALNDDLRRHLYDGGAILTPGIAALGEEAIGQLVNAIATFMISAPTTIHMASTILGGSILMARPSSSRLIIMTKTQTSTPPTQQTQLSPNGSSP